MSAWNRLISWVPACHNTYNKKSTPDAPEDVHARIRRVLWSLNQPLRLTCLLCLGRRGGLTLHIPTKVHEHLNVDRRKVVRSRCTAGIHARNPPQASASGCIFLMYSRGSSNSSSVGENSGHWGRLSSQSLFSAWNRSIPFTCVVLRS